MCFGWQFIDVPLLTGPPAGGWAEGEEQRMAKAAALEGLAWMLLKR